MSMPVTLVSTTSVDDMSIKQQRVLRPYVTFEGRTRYMIVREARECPTPEVFTILPVVLTE